MKFAVLSLLSVLAVYGLTNVIYFILRLCEDRGGLSFAERRALAWGDLGASLVEDARAVRSGVKFLGRAVVAVPKFLGRAVVRVASGTVRLAYRGFTLALASSFAGAILALALVGLIASVPATVALVVVRVVAAGFREGHAFSEELMESLAEAASDRLEEAGRSLRG